MTPLAHIPRVSDAGLHIIHYPFSATVLAHKECTANGTWWRHPQTGNPWSNYTTCYKPEDVGIVFIHLCYLIR